MQLKPRLAHRIPPRFLAQLGVRSVDVKFPSRKDLFSSVSVLTENGDEVGVVFEGTEIVPQGTNLEEKLVEVKGRLALRKQLNLAFLPRMLDYEAWVEVDRVKVLILLEAFGKSLLEKSKDAPLCTDSELQSWLSYSARALSFMTLNQACVLNIGPELLFFSPGAVSFLDLDDVFTNPAWTIDLSAMRPGNPWRHDRWNSTTIMCPPLYLRPENFSKFQVFMWAASFIRLMLGESFVEELNLALSSAKPPSQAQSFAKFIDLQRTLLLQTGSEARSKLALILTKCISYYPSQCPTFESLDQVCFSKIDSTPYPSLKHWLDDRCGNCGTHYAGGNVSACSGVKLCDKCLGERLCQICERPHKLSVAIMGGDSTLCLQGTEGEIYKVPCADTILGKDPKCSNLVLSGENIEAEHCIIRCGKEGSFYLKGLGSKAGTWVGVKGRVPLSEGMTIKMNGRCCTVAGLGKDTQKFEFQGLTTTIASSICHIGSAKDNEIVVPGADEYHIITETRPTGSNLHVVSISSGKTMLKLRENEEVALKDHDFIEIGDLRLQVKLSPGCSGSKQFDQM